MNSFPLGFAVPGFGKSGTTSICHMLARHPGICFSNPKEPNFFTEENYIDNWEAYFQVFSHGEPGQLYGEASTRYTSPAYEELVSDQLSRLYPQLKLIFVVREPIARIESSFREMHFRGPEYGFDAPFSIEEALELMPMMKQGSQYWARLKPYRQKFPEDQIHIVIFEDYVRSFQETLDAIFSFLGLNKIVFLPEDSVRLNSEKTKLQDTRILRSVRNTRLIGPLLSRMHREAQDKLLAPLGLRKRFSNSITWDSSYRRKLVDQLRPDVDALLSHLGRSAAVWGSEWA